MTSRFFCTLAAGSAFLLTGCQNNCEMPPQPPPAAVANPALKIAFQISPQPVRQMDPATLVVRLSDARGAAVKDALVRADLVMPSMDMGKNTIILTPRGSGTYSGTGRFSMDGKWLVNVTAAKGPEKAVQSYPVAVQ